MDFEEKLAAASLNEIEVYHGTVMYHDDEPSETDFHITELEVGTSDLPALWVANAEETADWFSRYHSQGGEDETFAVAKLRLNITKPFIIHPHQGRWLELELGDDTIEIDVESDREDLYNLLTQHGYDACIIRDNYGYGKDDIALLDDQCVSAIEGVKLSNDGHTWSEYFPPTQAHDEFIQMVGGEPCYEHQLTLKL